jgi:hypothetical protein
MNSLTWIEAMVPRDRRKLGALAVWDRGDGDLPPIVLAVFRAFFKADTARALAEGNPLRDTTHPYGDFPLGRWAISGCTDFNVDLTPWQMFIEDEHDGEDPFYLGAIESDDACWAFRDRTPMGQPKARRWGIDIHGGREAPEDYVYPHRMRPTFGCIRMLDRDLQNLIHLIGRRDIQLMIAAEFPGTLGGDY